MKTIIGWSIISISIALIPLWLYWRAKFKSDTIKNNWSPVRPGDPDKYIIFWADLLAIGIVLILI